VSIQEPDSISPQIRGGSKDVDDSHFNLDKAFDHQRRASIGRRMSSRPSLELLQRARTPAELLKIHHPSLRDGSASAQASSATGPVRADSGIESSSSSHRHGYRLTYHDLLRWIQKEKSRRITSKSHRQQKRKAKEEAAQGATQGSITSDEAPTLVNSEYAEGHGSRRGSESSEGSLVSCFDLQHVDRLADLLMVGSKRCY